MHLKSKINNIKESHKNEQILLKKRLENNIVLADDKREKEMKIFKTETERKLRNKLEKEWEKYIDESVNENIKLKSENENLKTSRDNYKVQFEQYKFIVEEQKLEDNWKQMQKNTKLNDLPFFKNIEFLKPSDEIVLNEMDNRDFLIPHLIKLNSNRKQVKGKTIHTSNNWKEYLFKPNDNQGQKFKINSLNTSHSRGRLYYKFEDEITKVMISSKDYQKNDFNKLKRL